VFLLLNINSHKRADCLSVTKTSHQEHRADCGTSIMLTLAAIIG